MPRPYDLLQRMRNSKNGWRFRDLDRLYTGFGFESREGGSHCVYSHPEHPELIATVTRSRTLAVGYIVHALSLIDALVAKEGNHAP